MPRDKNSFYRMNNFHTYIIIAGSGSRLSFWAEVAMLLQVKRLPHRSSGKQLWVVGTSAFAFIQPQSGPTGWPGQSPISFYGDAIAAIRATGSNSKSLEIYSFQGVLGHAPTMEVKLLIWSIFEFSKAKPGPTSTADTMKDVWALLVWPFHYLYLGIHPTLEYQGNVWPTGSAEAGIAGTWLAEGRFGVLWSLKGDLDHFSKTFGLERTSAERCCLLCPAIREGRIGMRWTNFNRGATWRQRRYTPSSWKAAATDPH